LCDSFCRQKRKLFGRTEPGGVQQQPGSGQRGKREKEWERDASLAPAEAPAAAFIGGNETNLHATHESHDDPSSTSCPGSGTASVGWADLPSRADACSQILLSSAEPTQTYLLALGLGVHVVSLIRFDV
jgi:hypothetical protein